MKRFIFILFLMLSTSVSAENIVRTVKDALKKPQKREQLQKFADNLMAEAAKPETRHKKRVDCIVLAAECHRAINAAENEKLYLKKPYDTVVFFNSILKYFTLLKMADSVAVQPNEKGKVDLSGRRKYREMLMPYRSNLLTGGNWNYQGGRTRLAYDFYDTYIESSMHPIFDKDSFLVKDKQIPLTAYLAVYSAQKEGLIDGVIKYAHLAKNAGQNSSVVQEFYARAWETKGDTVQWLEALKEGISSYADNLSFFTGLQNYYTSTSQWEKGLTLSDSLATAADTIPLFWYAKSLMLMQLKRNEEAIEACNACIKLDPNHTDALYIKGLASLNIAKEYDEKACLDIANPQYLRDREKVRSLFMQAKQPMERVRQLEPQSSDRWAPALYTIYLQLNMGKEFDEIGRILKRKH